MACVITGHGLKDSDTARAIETELTEVAPEPPAEHAQHQRQLLFSGSFQRSSHADSLSSPPRTSNLRLSQKV